MHAYTSDTHTRTHRRAREAVERATSGADHQAVEPGTYVRIAMKDVPVDKAAQVCDGAWGVCLCAHGCQGLNESTADN
jgi:hypothetical protein